MVVGLDQCITNQLKISTLIDSYDGFGLPGQVLTVDGNSNCVFEDISNINFRYNYLNLKQPAPEQIFAPLPRQSIYKYELEDGSANLPLAYQSPIAISNGYPTQLKNLYFCNRLPSHNLVCIGQGTIFPIPIGGSDRSVDFGNDNGTNDIVYYDPCNLRYGRDIHGNYDGFALNDALLMNNADVSSNWGTGVVYGQLKIEIQYSINFAGINNNEFSFSLFHRRAPPRGTDPLSQPLKSVNLLTTKKIKEDFYVGSFTKFINCYDVNSTIRIGDYFRVVIGNEASSGNAVTGGQAQCFISYYPF